MAVKKYVFRGMMEPDRNRDTRPIRSSDIGARTDTCDLALEYVPNASGSSRGAYYPLGADYVQRLADCVEAYHLLGARDDAGRSR